MNELTIGHLTFRIDRRETGDDRGPSIRVFGEAGGGEVQLLRFDCFDSDPHYHYDPAGENVMFHLDPLTMGDPLEFSLTQIARQTRSMIEKAGFPQAAESVDQAELAARIGEIREAVQLSTPA